MCKSRKRQVYLKSAKAYATVAKQMFKCGDTASGMYYTRLAKEQLERYKNYIDHSMTIDYDTKKAA